MAMLCLPKLADLIVAWWPTARQEDEVRIRLGQVHQTSLFGVEHDAALQVLPVFPWESRAVLVRVDREHHDCWTTPPRLDAVPEPNILAILVLHEWLHRGITPGFTDGTGNTMIGWFAWITGEA